MMRQKGFGLLLLLITLAIISFIAYGVFYNEEKGEEKSYLEERLDVVGQAEDIKNTLEQKDRENLNY